MAEKSKSRIKPVRIPAAIWNQLTQRDKQNTDFWVRLKNGKVIKRVLIDETGMIEAREIDNRAEFTLQGLDFAEDDVQAIGVASQYSAPRRWVPKSSDLS